MKRIFFSLLLLAPFFASSQNSFNYLKLTTYTASGTDTYAVTGIPGILSYVPGQEFKILFPNGNTGSATININSLGAKTLKKNGSTNLSASDILSGATYKITYDGTNFQVLGISAGGGSTDSTVFATKYFANTNFWKNSGTTTLTDSVFVGLSTEDNSKNITIQTEDTSTGTASLRLGTGALPTRLWFEDSGFAGGIQLTSSGAQFGSGALQLITDGTYWRWLHGSDAAGDMYFYDGSNHTVRLPIGTEGQVLTTTSGLPSWEDAPSGGITIGSTAITGGTNTRIPYNNSGVLGEYSLTGSGNVVMSTLPSITGGMNVTTGTSGADLNIFSSGAVNWLRFSNGSSILFNTHVSTTNRLTPQAGGLEFQFPGGSTAAASHYNIIPSGVMTATSGIHQALTIFENAAGTKLGATQSSGTTTYKGLKISGDWNFTSSYSGSLIGVEYDPTLTSATGLTNIFLKGTSGQNILGGSTPTAGTRLDIIGLGTGNDYGLRIANSSNTEKLTINAGTGSIVTEGSITTVGGVLTGNSDTFMENYPINHGVLSSGATSSNSIHVNAYYANKSVVFVEVTTVGIKTDGTGSVHATITGRFRKDNSGTFTADDTGTSATSDAAIISSLVLDVSGTNPRINVNMGGSSGDWEVGTVVKIIVTKN